MVETTAQVTPNMDTNGKQIFSLNVVPDVSITRSISRRTPVKLELYSHCPCLIWREEVKLEIFEAARTEITNDGFEKLVHQDAGAYPELWANEPTTPR